MGKGWGYGKNYDILTYNSQKIRQVLNLPLVYNNSNRNRKIL